MQCQAHAHRYVGKGKERQLYEGPCVLDRGHDEPCLPSGLAYANLGTQNYNEGVTAALAAAMVVLGTTLPVETEEQKELAASIANTMRDALEGIRKDLVVTS